MAIVAAVALLSPGVLRRPAGTLTPDVKEEVVSSDEGCAEISVNRPPRAERSPFALLISGGLRSFYELRHNLEAALVTPNGADAFAFITHTPRRPDHDAAVQWLAHQPWVVTMSAQCFTSASEQRLIADFPEYEQMDSSYRSPGSDGDRKATHLTNLLAMYRGFKAVNAMRHAHEERRGLSYSMVVRCRPDVAYGSIVPLHRLTHMLNADGRPTLFVPALPAARAGGLNWQFCEQLAGLSPQLQAYAQSCRVLEASPLLATALANVTVLCPCCANMNSTAFAAAKLHKVDGTALDTTCECDLLYDTTTTTTTTNDGTSPAHAPTTRQLGHPNAPSPAEWPAGWTPWSTTYFLDQIALGDGRGMDAFCNTYDQLSTLFANSNGTLWSGGFMPEKLMARSVRASGDVDVRVLSSLQWGTREDLGQLKEWEHWPPPASSPPPAPPLASPPPHLL